MGIQEQSWLLDCVRSLFGFLDRLVYSLIKWILFGIFDLANLTANSNVFNGIYSRIYVILGIFMAFKLSFSFFQYIIDPESMSGKSEKGLSKIFVRVFVMLGALVFIPMVLFGQNGQEGMLSRAQKAFLPSLPKIIFGVNNIGGISSGGSTTSQTFTETIEKSADDISVTTLRGFFAPVEEIDDVCGPRTYENTPQITSIDEFSSNINLTCNKKGDIVIGGAIHTGTKFYKYSYMFFISTVVGVLVGALLLGVTLSIAKRIFKLIILEVMAPIPIMSILDPKGMKDGAFRKWISSLLRTFGDIFMKLGLVYLIIVFIQLIVSPKDGGLFTNFPEHSGFRGTYLTILLILGLIFFAKEAPKFIKESLGFKGEGGLFDDVKSVGKAAGLVGGYAMGTVGTIGSTIGSVRAQHQGNVAENEEKGKSLGRSLLHGVRNVMAGVSGYAGGSAAAMKALTKKDAGIKSVMKAQQERNARDFEYRRNGGTFFGGLGSSASDILTGTTPYDSDVLRFEKDEEKIKADELALKNRQDELTRDKTANELRNDITKRAMDKAKEKTTTTGSYGGITGNWVAYNSAHSAAKSGVGLYKKYRDSTGNVISAADYSALSAADKANYQERTYFSFNGQDVDMERAEEISDKLLEENAKDFVINGNDAAINSKRDLFQEITGHAMEYTYDDIKAAYGSERSRIDNVSYSVSQDSKSINDRKSDLNKRKQDWAAQRRKANSSKYKASSKK